jgi:hypothetical protein
MEWSRPIPDSRLVVSNTQVSDASSANLAFASSSTSRVFVLSRVSTTTDRPRSSQRLQLHHQSDVGVELTSRASASEHRYHKEHEQRGDHRNGGSGHAGREGKQLRVGS